MKCPYCKSKNVVGPAPAYPVCTCDSCARDFPVPWLKTNEAWIGGKLVSVQSSEKANGCIVANIGIARNDSPMTDYRRLSFVNGKVEMKATQSRPEFGEITSSEFCSFIAQNVTEVISLLERNGE